MKKIKTKEYCLEQDIVDHFVVLLPTNSCASTYIYREREIGGEMGKRVEFKCRLYWTTGLEEYFLMLFLGLSTQGN